MNSTIEVLEVKIFKAKDDLESAKQFAQGHQAILKRKAIKGLDSADDSWLDNPGVYLMGIFQGDRAIAGARIHCEDEGYEYPFIKAIRQEDDDLLRVMDRSAHHKHAEACGLWVASSHAKLGLAEFLSRLTIATAHSLGLDYIYGLCPQHTLDPFRASGWHFFTLEDEVIEFAYPSPEFRTYVIKCEVAEMKYTFRSEKEIIKTWLSEPGQQVYSKGALGDCYLNIQGLPGKLELPLKKVRQIQEKKQKDYRFQKTHFPKAS